MNREYIELIGEDYFKSLPLKSSVQKSLFITDYVTFLLFFTTQYDTQKKYGYLSEYDRLLTCNEAEARERNLLHMYCNKFAESETQANLIVSLYKKERLKQKEKREYFTAEKDNNEQKQTETSDKLENTASTSKHAKSSSKGKGKKNKKNKNNNLRKQEENPLFEKSNSSEASQNMTKNKNEEETQEKLHLGKQDTFNQDEKNKSTSIAEISFSTPKSDTDENISENEEDYSQKHSSFVPYQIEKVEFDKKVEPKQFSRSSNTAANRRKAKNKKINKKKRIEDTRKLSSSELTSKIESFSPAQTSSNENDELNQQKDYKHTIYHLISDALHKKHDALLKKSIKTLAGSTSEYDPTKKSWVSLFIKEDIISTAECEAKMEILKETHLSNLISNYTEKLGINNQIESLKEKFLNFQLEDFINKQCSSITVKIIEELKNNFIAMFYDFITLKNKKLNNQIYINHTKVKQKLGTLQKKKKLFYQLSQITSKVTSDSTLYITGSTMNGFGNEDSDMDLVWITPKQGKVVSEIVSRDKFKEKQTNSINELKKLKTELESNGDIVDSCEIRQATVPILMIKINKSQSIELAPEGIKSKANSIDISVNSPEAVCNTHLLLNYSKFDWRLAPLTFAVKEWAKSNGIRDASTFSLSSYSWVLMVIHYLQSGTKPPVLPFLQDMYPDQFTLSANNLKYYKKFNTSFKNRFFQASRHLELGQLLLGFMHYYGYVFNFQSTKITIKHKDETKENEQNSKILEYRIFIEEPFTNKNTAESVPFGPILGKIKELFKTSFEKLYLNRELSFIFGILSDEQQ